MELLQLSYLDGGWSEAWVLVDMAAHAKLCQHHEDMASMLLNTSYDN